MESKRTCDGTEAHWKRDFPIRMSEDGYATRREFTKFLGLTSLAFFLGTIWAVGRRVWKQYSAGQQATLPVAKVDELAVGKYKQFRYPDAEGEPGILVRLDEKKYVAYIQSCTHLACPVHFKTETKQFVCPCHSGFFAADDGRVLAGPPKRPLARFDVEVVNDEICVRLPGVQA
jgi:nitrite reductase/ring-hydroxylating ferredoxin subunit